MKPGRQRNYLSVHFWPWRRLSAAGGAKPDTGAAKAKLYNTTKQKLLDGKQVFSFTQSKMDIADYCERAKHYDFTWFEMQHSTLEFADIEKMIAACRA